jgi:hypothetical protein
MQTANQVDGFGLPLRLKEGMNKENIGVKNKSKPKAYHPSSLEELVIDNELLTCNKGTFRCGSRVNRNLLESRARKVDRSYRIKYQASSLDGSYSFNYY